MVRAFWLLLCVAPAFGVKCARDYHYDGLLEECLHCSIRCNSPPTVCGAYCNPPAASSSDAAEEKPNVRVILIVLFVFLGVGFMLTLIFQVIRRKTCSTVSRTKAREQEASESERGSESTEQSDDGAAGVEESESGGSGCNSSLPLPSTEEGNTVLVTTKTVQTYSCRAHAHNVMLGVWTAEIP